MDILTVIRRDLGNNIDAKTRQTYQAFFKEQVNAYGVKTSIVSIIAKNQFQNVKHLGKRAIFALCEDLLKSDYNEEAFIAFKWAYWLHDEYEPDDFMIFERWLKEYVNNWAKCDTLCNHGIEAFIERYPSYVNNLKNWTSSSNRWQRRASSVTLVIPAKQGKFLKDILEIADLLLQDKDDLVQKGYGWMLKEASRSHQQEVFDYIIRNREVMPRTAFRYAIEKMPEELKRIAMKKK